jgi:two-component system, NarL family, sensor histidine kinase BarA
MNEKIKPRILIAEDDFENQKFLQLLLKKDFDVYTCDSEASFYQLLHKSKFDIIMVDISLKGLKNGLELTKELKSSSEYKHIPVVCLTAHAFREDKKNALDAGVDIFLTKPIDNNVLLNTLLKIKK